MAIRIPIIWLTVIACLLLPIIIHAAETKAKIQENQDQGIILTTSAIPKKIELSRSIIHRIAGPAPIKKINAPKGLHLEVEYQGNNAFIKLGWQSKKGIVYIITQSDEVFSAEIIPKKGVPVRVITLQSKDHAFKKHQVMFAKMSQETACVELIRGAFADTIPDTFNVVPINREIKAVKNLRILLRRQITADGVPLELNEYIVSLAALANTSQIKVDESSFLVPRLTRHPAAISLGKDLSLFAGGKVVLEKGQYLRLFIVERKKTEI